MSLPLGGHPSVVGVNDHPFKEARMSRITHSTFRVRVALLTTFISVVGLIVPLVALAGNGDPTGI